MNRLQAPKGCSDSIEKIGVFIVVNDNPVAERSFRTISLAIVVPHFQCYAICGRIMKLLAC